jgi:hypothetical protein
MMTTGVFQPIIHFAPASLSFVGWFAALSSRAEVGLGVCTTAVYDGGRGFLEMMEATKPGGPLM